MANRLFGIICAAALTFVPGAAWADAATHTLTLEATSRPATANDGPSCLLVGHLHAVGPTSSDIEVVLVAGGDSGADQGELVLSFSGLKAGGTATAQVDVGGGGCAAQVIRKAKVDCPKDGRMDQTYTCRAFTWVQFPRMDAPPMAAVRVGEQWETRIRPASAAGVTTSSIGSPASTPCQAAPALVAGTPGGGVAHLPPDLMTAALEDLAAHGCPAAGSRLIGVVDFSPASDVPRLWIVDLDSGNGADQPLYVAHGKGSDPSNSGRATVFSDRAESLMSSLGGYRVGPAATTSRHGPVLLLHGLDVSNAHAFSRALLIHTSTRGPADYVSQEWLSKYGKLGRSHGCFVVMAADFERVFAALAHGGFLFAGRSAADL